MDQRKTRGRPLVHEPNQAKPTASSQVRRSFDSNSSLIHRFEVSKTELAPKLLRYKSEVLESAQEAFDPPCLIMSGLIRDSCNRSSNTLLDDYEIEWISRELNYYIESSHGKCNRYGGFSGQMPEVVEGGNSKVVLKKNFAKWFWLRRGILCSSSAKDVVEAKKLELPRRKKGGITTAMEVVGCRRPPSLVADQSVQVGRF